MSDSTLQTVRDTEETHYRCGGNLIPIADPSWLIRHPKSITHNSKFAQCDRCELPGEVFWVNARP